MMFERALGHIFQEDIKMLFVFMGSKIFDNIMVL